MDQSFRKARHGKEVSFSIPQTIKASSSETYIVQYWWPNNVGRCVIMFALTTFEWQQYKGKTVTNTS